jgi:hypothetical protein
VNVSFWQILLQKPANDDDENENEAGFGGLPPAASEAMIATDATEPRET